MVFFFSLIFFIYFSANKVFVGFFSLLNVTLVYWRVFCVISLEYEEKEFNLIEIRLIVLIKRNERVANES